MSRPEDPLRAAILHEMFAVDDDGDEFSDGESPFADLPGVWLDELESLGELMTAAVTGDEPVVVLDPRIYYGDTWAPPLLDELLFGHQCADLDSLDDGET